MAELKIYDDTMKQDIKGFYERCFADLGWAYEPEGRHSDTVNIRESYMSEGCMWCMYDGERLIGTSAVRTIDKDNKTAELKRLYVSEEYQGRGYGGVLFDTAVAYAAENGFNKICADTRNDREASKHLMRSRGFREVLRYNDNQQAELFFERKL
jgi:GNAT superfamily N-acetyltransferase